MTKYNEEAMLKDLKFNRYILKSVSGRTDEIVNDMAETNRVYKKHTEKIILLLKSIYAALSREEINLIDELEDIRGRRDLLIYKALYMQGLKDGIKLCNIFHRFK